MITGMTGFGASEITFGKVKGVVEIKTVNHRYLDVAFYLPVGFSSLEDKIQKIIAGQIKRGRVTVSVKITDRPHTNIILNQEAVKRYLDFAKSLGQKHHIKNDITVADIMRLPGVVEAKEVFVQAGETVACFREIFAEGGGRGRGHAPAGRQGLERGHQRPA